MSALPWQIARYGGWLRYVKVKRIAARIRQGQELAALRSGELDLETRLGRTYVYRALAARFNVSTQTVYRDLRLILSRSPVCPLCGQDVPTSPQAKQDKKSK